MTIVFTETRQQKGHPQEHSEQHVEEQINATDRTTLFAFQVYVQLYSCTSDDVDLLKTSV